MSDLSQARNFDEFMEGIWRQNPVFVMVLGMCPTLAVTVSAMNALSMGLATAFVLVCSCGLVSLMRRIVPKEVRIATYIVIIASSPWSITSSRRSAWRCTTRWAPSSS